MKYALTLGLVGAFAIAIVVIAFPQALAQSQTISGVASVVDGDTIEIHGERIRLSGFDAPESGARCGRSNVYNLAANALADRIGSSTVTCTATGRDAYGRTTADCSVDGVDLGERMVGAGWARDWPRYSGGRYAAAEAQARAEGIGVWGMNCPANLWGNRDYSATATSSATTPQALLSERAFVTASSLNVRAGAGAENAIVGRLARGAEVTIVARTGEWARLAPTGSHESGWVSSSYLSAEAPQAESASDSQIRQRIMRQSLAYYSGSCPCPYNVDRAGRRCGRRSAYSRPGGASPMCYPSDVSDAQVQAFRARQN
jgi:endonuclease YncB( thermonuclease family)